MWCGKMSQEETGLAISHSRGDVTIVLGAESELRRETVRGVVCRVDLGVGVSVPTARRPGLHEIIRVEQSVSFAAHLASGER